MLKNSDNKETEAVIENNSTQTTVRSSYHTEENNSSQTAGNAYISQEGKIPKTEFKEEFLGAFKQSFHPMEEFTASYAIDITDMEKTLIVEVDGSKLKCYYGQKEDASVIARTNKEIMQSIVKGKMTLQKAFMSGELTAKGNFKTLRSFDTIFRF